MIANGKSTATPRPWIGVNTQEVQGNLIVTRVSPEGPADDAGLEKGDVIVGIGGKAIQGQADFYTKLWATGNAGVDVPLEILKGNQVQKYTVKSRDRQTYFRSKPVY
jgi:S1-C subfamily serine protease